jgi:hypothetical protein
MVRWAERCASSVKNYRRGINSLFGKGDKMNYDDEMSIKELTFIISDLERKLKRLERKCKYYQTKFGELTNEVIENDKES